MKKLLVYAATTGFLFTACQKEEATTNAPITDPSGIRASNIQNVSPVPATFTKKVLIEEFTSCASGLAPETSSEILRVVKGNAGKVYHASLHTNDIMAQVHTNRMLSLFSPASTTFPCASTDRINYAGNRYLTTQQIGSAVAASLQKPVECGLAIQSAVNGNVASITVHAGFSANTTGNYNVTAYLVEDAVTSTQSTFYQANAFNLIPSSPFYGAGNPIRSYTHYNVVRRVLSPTLGNSINPTAFVAGGSDIISYTTDIPKKYSTNSAWKIIAFITHATSNEILNVQIADVGRTKDWN
jgi:hypothetical protein